MNEVIFTIYSTATALLQLAISAFSIYALVLAIKAIQIYINKNSR